MNKFCKSSLCVEKKVRERYVLNGRRVVAVPGGVDAIRLPQDFSDSTTLTCHRPVCGLELSVRTEEDSPPALRVDTC
ncbi:hypothetical protein RR48_07493 [Papilio machaon]|uniref:Uncharacterized protein n=1 Tax=Papilio machaon TaxID=76193 RepID=A0A194RQ83_PAPMA|nr:hypothetical protein RR48_07493 [Papilio machaon]